MKKNNRYMKKIVLLCFLSFSMTLSACNSSVSETDSPQNEESAPLKKDKNHYGENTELLDVEASLTLELFGEQKQIPADMVVLENKIKVLLPSELYSISVGKDDIENGVSYSVENISVSDEYGVFFLEITQEEYTIATPVLANIYHHNNPYDIESLPKLYPATAKKYDFLSVSKDEESHRYFFAKTVEEKKQLYIYKFAAFVQDDSKELESLICAIAASIEHL